MASFVQKLQYHHENYQDLQAFVADYNIRLMNVEKSKEFREIYLFPEKSRIL